ncbi:hypothetical protein DICPUDRAFT_147058 [Dictyostelium purpureum]|uniref:CobW C-terminal domain-containing protein n=1 Tax=Dictyostelium purpureum TaxID=5786 RepID=F0Z7J6_DICPU|nr:uncharacterized protein DICPUDRAFT_147058 [Dictyostelium purpureum]EGC40071.1 hypothetical protein DICPUDRAFT_147058 [Dictyostelium purpureum]|eukprot:XP_003283420.1 hypothetical protein DICPUDRAFT_147058 [Dictyostelium purpureum]
MKQAIKITTKNNNKKTPKMHKHYLKSNQDNYKKMIHKLKIKDFPKLPVTVLSGFLGSGKTTLLNYVLNSNHGLKIAVIVNDMSEVNIDARLIKDGFKISRTVPSEKTVDAVVEMQNGFTKLAKERKFDYLIVESSGISEPLPVAETFTFEIDGSIENLKDYTKLDTMVTVVDCSTFLEEYLSGESLKDKEMGVTEEDERSIVDLLVDQIEFSNVILLNKCDLVDKEEIDQIEGLVKHINPDAKILRSTKSVVPLDKILNTGLFDFKKASEHPGWLAELRGTHVPETIEYGIRNFIYRARRPFHSERLNKVIGKGSKVFGGVLRSKGFTWVASTPELIGMWNIAGISMTILNYGYWLADLKKSEYPSLEIQKMIREKWEEPFGDRRQEIVFIGNKMNQELIEKELNNCLLTDKELKQGPEVWKTWADPIALNEEEEIEIDDDGDMNESY